MMGHTRRVFALICVVWLIEIGSGFKPKCLSVPTFPAKVELHLKTCQSEVKSNIVDDLVHTTFNDNPFSSAEYAELLKPHVEHLHKSKRKPHHHHQFNADHFKFNADHIKKPHFHHTLGGYEYFDHDHHNSHAFDEFASLRPATPSFANAVYYNSINGGGFGEEEAHRHSLFPEYALDHNLHITPSTLFVTPATEVEERVEKQTLKEDKVVEAREELMNILANHKIIQRQINRKNSRNNHTKSGGDDHSPANAKRGQRSKRGILDFFNRNNKHEDLPHTAPGLDLYHPMLLTDADRWLAGCMMQCIFKKTHAVDKYGYPTLDGVVDLYTDGVHDQAYFIYTLRAVNKCLKIISKKHHISRSKTPIKATTCEVAFDVFDCVSDAITAYCH